MPMSQIKQAPDDFFQLRISKILDTLRAPCDFMSFRLSSHKSNGQFLWKCRACTFQFGKTPGSNWTATGRHLLEHLTDFVQPSRYRPIAEWSTTVYGIICVQPFVKNRCIN